VSEIVGDWFRNAHHKLLTIKLNLELKKLEIQKQKNENLKLILNFSNSIQQGIFPPAAKTNFKFHSMTLGDHHCYTVICIDDLRNSP